LDKFEPNILTDFKKDCVSHSATIIAQKYMIEGSSHFFTSNYDTHEEYLFKLHLANSLQVHLREVCIVGSAKLGFSIKPNKDQPGFYEFKSFDHDYSIDNSNKKSDIDVAIISGSLFDRQIKNIYEHTNCYDKSNINNQEIKSLGSYILKGWIYPKVLPQSYQLDGDYLKIKEKYEREFNREINIGIYKSWFFFEKYHESNIYNLYLNLLSST
jgi:hypothetical protein